MSNLASIIFVTFDGKMEIIALTVVAIRFIISQITGIINVVFAYGGLALRLGPFLRKVKFLSGNGSWLSI